MSNADSALPKQRLLVVDDEQSLREYLTILLERQGYDVFAAADGSAAWQLLQQQPIDLLLADVKMPGMGGLELLQQVRQALPQTAVIMLTAYGSPEDAVAAMKQGAADYLTKPVDNDHLRQTVRRVLEQQALLSPAEALPQCRMFGHLVGHSAAMQQVFHLISKVAPTRVNVLISGESGTGKELAAKAIHYGSPRREQSFVAVNCGAIPPQLLESELFGHEKGAFTGAHQAKVGLFEQAHAGTLFLDEVAELPLALQVKLLRVLQERILRRVGGVNDIQVDLRLICATNRHLPEEVTAGRFREDLFYRLNVVQLELPSLRQRPEDIPPLVRHFLRKWRPDQPPEVSPKVMQRLQAYAWPGNVRELENVLERALVLGGEHQLDETVLPDSLRQQSDSEGKQLPAEGLDLDAYLAGQESSLLQQALKRCQGNRTQAAKLLGISFRSLRYRLKKLGVEESGDAEP